MEQKPGKSKGARGWRRWGVMVGVALLAWAVAIVLQLVLPGVTGKGEEFFYDTYYRARPVTDMTGGAGADVVLVVADQTSLEEMDKRFHYGWPWPRKYWGMIARYLDKAGAKAIAFDLVFTETSAYEKAIKEEEGDGDDELFAAALGSLKTPVVFGSMVKPDGAWGRFAVPVAAPKFGAVNVGNDKIYRRYVPQVFGKESLAPAVVEASGSKLALKGDEPFSLHYYGPHVSEKGKTTFSYVQAHKVLGAEIDGAEGEKAYGISPEMFRGKIVILGAIAVGTYDLKSSPLSAEFPGPEVQATAIENFLRGEEVRRVGDLWLWITPLLCSLVVSAGVIFPRRAVLKLIGPVVGVAGLVGIGVWLFCGKEIVWLPPVAGLVAIAVALPLAFAWTYFAEDRQRRFMLKALSKVVSPAVAEQLARDPEKLALGTTRTELTVMFTDLANFTGMAEGMDVQQLGEMLNRYLGAMSDRVLAQDGTLDKYIGDAVMCFWNAPLRQEDHAVRACRAALAMVAREKAMREAKDLPAAMRTRIGINTATMAVGFVGSSHLFNYTALGDGVNLASRIEGANKLYGTQILATENTAGLVREKFHLRKVDVLRVKGKREPMAVYEVMAERGAGDGAGGDDRIGKLGNLYEAAFAAYQRQAWDEAEKMVLEVFQGFGEDGPAKALMGRIKIYRQTPPGEQWDGVFEATEK